ncbi:MAG TPA: IS21 family transposase, partial [Dehalococcoidia bacterium]|nr:IS21 family transposase [Dehalococcoidia bacterium]
MEERLDVQALWRAGKTVSEIARTTGRNRRTIRRLIHQGVAQPRTPRLVSSKLDPFREYLLQRLLEGKVSNAAVLFDEIRERGYTGGRSILWEFLHPLRELLVDRATMRFETPPGRQAQVDWGMFRKPARKRVQAFVLTLGWSRASYLDFSETQALPALLRCHEHAFHYLGGVPEEILYDRMKTVWLRDDHRGDPVFHPGLLDFAQHYGFRPRLCHARRPQTKGKVENGIGYVGKNFWPRVDAYDGAAELVPLGQRWLEQTANVRVHGTTGVRPIDRLPLEQLRPVAGVPPYRALVLERRRVARDCYLSYAGSWYSVPAEYAGREVWVRQTDERVIISAGDQVLADHRLVEGRCQRVTNPVHFQSLAARRDRRLQLETAKALVALPQRSSLLEGPEVEKRSLAVYEALL